MEYGEVITDGAVNAIIDNYSSDYLTNWIKSAIDNGGYYIGRYEYGLDMTDYSYGTRAGMVSYFVYDIASEWMEWNVPHNEFAYQDIVNSFAWDTAIYFIEICSGNSNYANTNYLNLYDHVDPGSGYPLTGVSNDVVCNIYDMAGVHSEWVREYDLTTNYRYVLRGGYNEGNGLGAGRRGMVSDLYGAFAGTRLTLYIYEE